MVTELFGKKYYLEKNLIFQSFRGEEFEHVPVINKVTDSVSPKSRKPQSIQQSSTFSIDDKG